jgi:hypothetical protein
MLPGVRGVSIARVVVLTAMSVAMAMLACAVIVVPRYWQVWMRSEPRPLLVFRLEWM